MLVVAVGAKNWRRWAHIRVAAEAEAGGTVDVGAQALDVELVEGAPRRGYVEALCAGRRAREDTEGAHPAQGEQRTGRGVFSVSSSTSCPTSNCTVCTSRREAPPCAGPARAGPSALRWSCSSCRNARTNAVSSPLRVAASSPGTAG